MTHCNYSFWHTCLDRIRRNQEVKNICKVCKGKLSAAEYEYKRGG